MSNIYDYIAEQGKETLEQRPFNAVDNLIMAELSYVWFDGAVPYDFADDSVLLRDTAETVLADMNENAPHYSMKILNDERLLRDAAKSVRFGNLRLTGYINNFDRATEKQFAAITFLLPDNSAYAAFRGTDQTLIGWKEDFNLSFQSDIPSQLDAAAYLNALYAAYPIPLRVGGHSKGGNLAVYAAAFCDPAVQLQITDVYNNDGPGFLDGVMERSGYQIIEPCIQTYLPQSSIVGMLLNHSDKYTVIRSSQHGVFQHDPFTWKVENGDFITVEGLTNSGQLVNDALSDWIMSLDMEQRAAFADALYSLLGSTDAVTVTQLLLPTHYRSLVRAMRTLEPDKRKLLSQVFKMMRQSFSKTASEALAGLNEK